MKARQAIAGHARAGAEGGERVREAPQGPSLGKNADVAATAGQRVGEAGDPERVAAHTRQTWAQMRLLWEVSSLARVRTCRRVPRSASGGVIRATQVAERQWSTGLANLCHCGSPWACPMCTPMIGTGRLRQTTDLFTEAHRRGHGAGFMTLTNSHHRGHRLTDLREHQAEAFRRTLATRAVKQARVAHGVTGFLHGREVMHSVEAGWHPHSHLVWLFDRLISPERYAEFGGLLHAVYAGELAKLGDYRSTWEHGLDLQVVDLQDADGALTQYLHKFGREMSTPGTKLGRRQGHLTPFELLEEFRTTGNVEYLERWHEYEAATHGKQRINPSKGLWELYGVSEETDEELANVDLSGDDVAELDSDALRAVLPQVEEVLVVGQREGPDGIRRWLDAHGIAWSKARPRGCSGPQTVRPGIRVPVYLPGTSSGSRRLRRAHDEQGQPDPRRGTSATNGP